MGAWGHGSFENDDAMDWLQEFEDGPVGAHRPGLPLAGAAGGAMDALEDARGDAASREVLDRPDRADLVGDVGLEAEIARRRAAKAIAGRNGKGN